MGLPPHPRRARGARHHGGAVNGLADPQGRRDGPGWAEFLRSQAQGILALDFFTADLLNGTRVYVLAAIKHCTHRIRILGATEHPPEPTVLQTAPKVGLTCCSAITPGEFGAHLGHRKDLEARVSTHISRSAESSWTGTRVDDATVTGGR